MRRHFFRVVEELLCASALTRPGSPYGFLEAVCPGGVGWVGGEAWFSLMIMLMIVIMMIREWWCDSSHDNNNDYRTNYYYHSIYDDCQYLSSVIHSSSIIHHPPFFISLICLISLSNCSFGAIRDPLRNHRLFAQLQVSDECLRRRIFLFGRHGPRSAAARHPEKTVPVAGAATPIFQNFNLCIWSFFQYPAFHNAFCLVRVPFRNNYSKICRYMSTCELS